jgi:DNA-binding NarL/FixJ family response regulator
VQRAAAVRILVCDDHPVFREGLRDALAELPAEIVEAADGAAALRAVDADPGLDLVLLDLTLPGADGWAIFGALRSRHPALPVVIVSASEDPADVRRALDQGAAGFVPKSSTVAVLRQALRLVLAGGVYVPAAALAAARPPGAAAGAQQRRTRAALLTPRQLEVLVLMSRGLTNREIAGALGIAEGTVKTHARTLYEVLDVSNRTEAALVMSELGLDGSAADTPRRRP